MSHSDTTATEDLCNLPCVPLLAADAVFEASLDALIHLERPQREAGTPREARAPPYLRIWHLQGAQTPKFSVQLPISRSELCCAVLRWHYGSIIQSIETCSAEQVSD